MTAKRRASWSDDDRRWGPLLYSRAAPGEWRPTALVLSSEDDEDQPCRLRLSALGHTLILTLPPVVRPYRRWVEVSSRGFAFHDGRRGFADDDKPRGYWDVHERRYGFTLADSGTVGGATHLTVHLGPETGDSSTTRSWTCFLPWTDWRYIRRSFFGLRGEHVGTVFARGPAPRQQAAERDVTQTAIEICPTVTCDFLDFDGERLSARLRIEEREWRRGKGLFRWLEYVSRPIVRRTLSIDFSGEVGRRKGSWKGGTLGHAVEMRPGELHRAAFVRYCAENRLTFLGEPTSEPERWERVGTSGTVSLDGRPLGDLVEWRDTWTGETCTFQDSYDPREVEARRRARDVDRALGGVW